MKKLILLLFCFSLQSCAIPLMLYMTEMKDCYDIYFTEPSVSSYKESRQIGMTGTWLDYWKIENCSNGDITVYPYNVTFNISETENYHPCGFEQIWGNEPDTPFVAKYEDRTLWIIVSRKSNQKSFIEIKEGKTK